MNKFWKCFSTKVAMLSMIAAYICALGIVTPIYGLGDVAKFLCVFAFMGYGLYREWTQEDDPVHWPSSASDAFAKTNWRMLLAITAGIMAASGLHNSYHSVGWSVLQGVLVVIVVVAVLRKREDIPVAEALDVPTSVDTPVAEEAAAPSAEPPTGGTTG